MKISGILHFIILKIDLVEDLNKINFSEDKIRDKAFIVFKRDFSPDQVFNNYNSYIIGI